IASVSRPVKPKIPAPAQKYGRAVTMWNILATTFIGVKTWLWDVTVKNTVPPLAAVIGVLGISNVPAGKVLVNITRSVSTRVSVTVAVLPVVMCADA